MEHALGFVEGTSIDASVQAARDHLEKLLDNVLLLVEVDGLDAELLLGPLEAEGNSVDTDDSPEQVVERKGAKEGKGKVRMVSSTSPSVILHPLSALELSPLGSTETDGTETL